MENNNLKISTQEMVQVNQQLSMEISNLMQLSTVYKVKLQNYEMELQQAQKRIQELESQLKGGEPKKEAIKGVS